MVICTIIDDGHRVVLKSISDVMDCDHDYINATYIDVRLFENIDLRPLKYIYTADVWLNFSTHYLF